MKKRQKRYPTKKTRKIPKSLVIIAISFLIISIFSIFNLFPTTSVRAQTFLYDWIKDILYISRQQPVKSLKLGTFVLPTPTITPIHSIQQFQSSPAGPIPISTPAIGGPVPPSGYYCIDDIDPDSCDDNTSHLVPKGTTGVTGSCGKIIEWSHRLVDSLPHFDKGIRDSLNPAVSNSCHSTGPYSAGQYIQTYLIIDAYNLAGFKELSKTNPNHVSPTGLFNFWQSPPAGYEYIPNSPTVIQQFASGQKDLTGCVMFLRLGSGSFHIGIVNKLELYSANGDGVLSILQSGTRFYLDRFPVAGWNIRNTSTNQTTTSGVEGFGCHR